MTVPDQTLESAGSFDQLRGFGLSSRLTTALILGLVSIGLLGGLFLMPAPYAIFGPGPATNVLGKVGDKQLISISGAPSYPAQGTLDMTTIEVFGGPGSRITLVRALRGWLSGKEAVVPEEQVFPRGRTAKQVQSENSADMASSQEEATAAGLREAGLKVTAKITIDSVRDNVPAARTLKAADVLVKVRGTEVTDPDSIRSAIKDLQPGDLVPITVRRGQAEVDLTVTTTEFEGRTALGVNLRSGYDFPVKVNYATQDVGGPSAGMIFALGIYDLLTPGELTAGKAIAGTGTIDGSGKVGPIGGIAQKLVGAKRAGAQWFIAPSDNCNEVVGHIPDGLRVVRSATLHESRLAITAIAAGKGDALPGCTAATG